MLESINVTERLHWPEFELSKKHLLSPTDNPVNASQIDLYSLCSTVLKDIFTTSTNSYNVLLQTKEEKKMPKLSSANHKKVRKSARQSPTGHSREHRKANHSVPLPANKLHNSSRSPEVFLGSPFSSNGTFIRPIAVTGNQIGLSSRPKGKSKRHYFSSLQKTKPSQLPKVIDKECGISTKRPCILTAIKPSNVEKEKAKFFKSEFTYNPQFEYDNPASPYVLEKYSNASDKFLMQAIKIMEVALQKYGSYEKFEYASGGSLLTKSRIWFHVKKYMEKEECLGEIVVHLTDDLLSRASMTVVNGRPTLTINMSSAREHWLEGMLRHEIGTHYVRGINNALQPWCTLSGRKKHGLKPVNPTEEGLASIHSVLFRKDPFLWRAALLYYTVYQASYMSFAQLFHNVGRFVKDPNTRWDYCVRAKRGQKDTSLPGCFSKDQVYLDGILKILRYRETIDFQLLTALGKVSYEDVDRLKGLAIMNNVRIPHFLQDQARYKEQLNKIMEVNHLTDAELQTLL
ncbi:uncharacterized protein KIAA0895 [Polypterus senegalus]|uniref:uncharacterized protein KIAA0895 n=1 Tax=Polypterus senegalus TaxID=55291 RepID=UPI001962B26C|nr:uncharacterized protein KIAA0895 [Polypterus senegalus]